MTRFVKLESGDCYVIRESSAQGKIIVCTYPREQDGRIVLTLQEAMRLVEHIKMVAQAKAVEEIG